MKEDFNQKNEKTVFRGGNIEQIFTNFVKIGSLVCEKSCTEVRDT